MFHLSISAFYFCNLRCDIQRFLSWTRHFACLFWEVSRWKLCDLGDKSTRTLPTNKPWRFDPRVQPRCFHHPTFTWEIWYLNYSWNMQPEDTCHWEQLIRVAFRIELDATKTLVEEKRFKVRFFVCRFFLGGQRKAVEEETAPLFFLGGGWRCVILNWLYTDCFWKIRAGIHLILRFFSGWSTYTAVSWKDRVQVFESIPYQSIINLRGPDA